MNFAYADISVVLASLNPYSLSNADFGVAWVEVVDDDSGHFVMSEAYPALITDSQEAVDELHRFTNSDFPISLPQAVALLQVGVSVS